MMTAFEDLASQSPTPTTMQRDASVRAAREATLRLIAQAHDILEQLKASQHELEELLSRLHDQVQEIPDSESP